MAAQTDHNMMDHNMMAAQTDHNMTMLYFVHFGQMQHRIPEISLADETSKCVHWTGVLKAY
jgi:hypothetical protein